MFVNSYIIGANAAGVGNKLESLNDLLTTFSPIAVLIQEAKIVSKSKVSFANYTTFHYKREGWNIGGGSFSNACVWKWYKWNNGCWDKI